jgi:hypothetical protein
MTAHMYGSPGGFDHYGKSVPIHRSGEVGTPECESARSPWDIPDGVIRLSCNLAGDVAAVLKRWAEQKRISITESVRRAISVWNFVETEIAAGGTMFVRDVDGTFHEVVMLEDLS